MRARLLLWYFKIHRWEYLSDKTPIYEFMGIRWYKKWVPSTGDKVRHWRKVKQLDIAMRGRCPELYRYELQTRNYELRHMAGLLGFVLLFFLIDKKMVLLDWVFLFFLNLAVNIYPICLQRYNRIRIVKVLRKMGCANPL